MWVVLFLALELMILSAIAATAIVTDPFFHYHKPNVEKYAYYLNNQRSMNNGIVKHFEYDAIITGTSMTENSKPSEIDAMFGTNCIKIPYSGGTFKEINDNLAVALQYNSNLKIVFRGLDMLKFIEDKDAMREDLGEFPTYLYDDNIFNDVKYVFNRDVLFTRVYSMIKESNNPIVPHGVSSFDEYAYWMPWHKCGKNEVCPAGIQYSGLGEAVHLTEDEKVMVKENVVQNITTLAKQYPNVTFYYFVTPYGAAWWENLASDGTIFKQIEAERILIEEVLSCDNIKLFSFNNLTDLTTDMNNYRDQHHYAAWINSLMFRYMHDEKCLITKDNYEKYLKQELDFYSTYDYNLINNQVDYENDYYADAILNQAIWGVKPFRVAEKNMLHSVLDDSADLSATPYKLYANCIVNIENVDAYRYLVFDAYKKDVAGSSSVVRICNNNDEVIMEIPVNSNDFDTDKKQFVIDIAKITGNVSIEFNGGYVDINGKGESVNDFADIVLY